MGNNKQKSITSSFSTKELDSLNTLFIKEFSSSTQFDKSKFSNFIFHNKNNNFPQLIDSLYQSVNVNIDYNLNQFHYFLFYIHLLLKSNQDSEHLNTKLYYGSNISNIIYDAFSGIPNSYSTSFSKEILNKFLSWVYSIYHQILIYYVNQSSQSSQSSTKSQETEFINTLPNFSSMHSLQIFLYNIEGFIEGYLRSLLLFSIDEFKFTNPFGIPFPTEVSKTISMPRLLTFSLSCSNIFGKKHFYKLFDCSDSGFNLSNIIYSFLGFPDPILIILEDFDKQTGKESIIGIYINSNFKECYESTCGDDLSFLFGFDENGYHSYKFIGNQQSKILFISSKNHKYSNKKAGIGFGDDNGEYRFWIDGDDIFKKSYFSKSDSAFQEGSVYDKEKHFFNLVNIEVFGVGNEDSLKGLVEKQEKDKKISDQMKKIDKTKLINSQFDKEILFGKTFRHGESVRESN